MRRSRLRAKPPRMVPALLTTVLSTMLTASVLAPAHAAVPARPGAPAPAPGVTVTPQRIPGADGVPLDAQVIEPPGEGPFPVLVMPASWGTPNIEYVGAAADLAYHSGYVVISYTTRGFYTSGGQVEVGGPEDVADASKVIDWALAHTRADPERVGMAGISYGAGISALTAAADPRVRAISAMSGWSDFVASLYPNRTVSTQAAELLLGLGHLTSRFGDDLTALERAYREGHVEDALGMAPERSAITKIDRLNANGTAVMLANAWEDSLFPPQQMADLYQGLTGPKRLMLSPGDHATPELFGAAGLPNDVWDSTRRGSTTSCAGSTTGSTASPRCRSSRSTAARGTDTPTGDRSPGRSTPATWADRRSNRSHRPPARSRPSGSRSGRATSRRARRPSPTAGP